ncbi:MAG TPA: response regulator [Planctomycetota bacterium]
MRILLVDDSRATRMIVRSTLQSMGLETLEILEAADGEEGLELLRNEKLEIDLVLADWDMPRMDGVTFLKQLRVVAPFREIPVIMVTSQSSRDKVTEALRLGAKDYVIKPFSSAVLLEKIRAVKGQIDAKKSDETSILLRDMVAASRAEKEQPFLRQLPEGITQFLMRTGARKTWPPGKAVLTAGQAVEALHILVSGEVEIEGHGKVREGDCVEARAFMSGEPAAATSTARTAAQGLLFDRLALGEGLRRHPRLGHYLRGLLSAPAAPASPDTAPLTGTLADFPIVDIVQVLSMTQKTGTLKLGKKGKDAGMAMERGEVRHAWVENLEGEDAFYRLLDWDDATFAFESGRLPTKVTIGTPTMTMLMEGARRKDETKILTPPAPKAEAPQAPKGPEPFL